MAEQCIFLGKLLDRAIDHLGDDVSGLAAFSRLFGGDRALALDHVLVKPGFVQRQRKGRRDMHRNLLAQRIQRLCIGFALQRDKHANLAEARRLLVMDIRHNCPRRHFQPPRTADRLILADRGDIVRQHFLNRLAIERSGLDHLKRIAAL